MKCDWLNTKHSITIKETVTDPALTIELRNMPATRVGLTMSWRDLLFLHYACEPEAIQKFLPRGLSVDTFPDDNGKEMAWIGLVPFRMEAVRPRGVLRIRACEDFPETNVRTYCHVDGQNPGVWFFSLDAANPFACAFARQFFHLPYKEAKMTVDRTGDEVHYESTRRCQSEAVNSVHCRVGAEIGKAEPGTLEFFLAERYLLYSYNRERLFAGQVFHQPYPLQKVEAFTASSGLIKADGLDPLPFTHALFSPGVDVSAGRLAKVE
jgi:uncharacterized protein YqjF (DUF2071 family)